MDIYVGNLAYATTDDGLKAAFAAYGEVTSARVPARNGVAVLAAADVVTAAGAAIVATAVTAAIRVGSRI